MAWQLHEGRCRSSHARASSAYARYAMQPKPCRAPNRLSLQYQPGCTVSAVWCQPWMLFVVTGCSCFTGLQGFKAWLNLVPTQPASMPWWA